MTDDMLPGFVATGSPSALAMEPPDHFIMQRPPHEPVLTVQKGVSILINGVLIAVTTAAGFWLVYRGAPRI